MAELSLAADARATHLPIELVSENLVRARNPPATLESAPTAPKPKMRKKPRKHTSAMMQRKMLADEINVSTTRLPESASGS